MQNRDLYFMAKGWNRRVFVFYDGDEDVYIVKTKRLVSRERRHITETENIYSAETFGLIVMIIDILMETPEFKNSNNRAWGRINKKGKVEITTNAYTKQEDV